MTRCTAPLASSARFVESSAVRSRRAHRDAAQPSLTGVGVLIVLAALAGCGGGGGGSTDNKSAPAAAVPAPVAESTLTGKVAIVPVPVLVTVSLTDPSDKSKTITLSTGLDSSGSFSLAVPSSVVPKNSQIAAVISADGYLPTTIIYATSSSGALTLVSATNALGTQLAPATIVLAPVASNVLAFPGLEDLHRLGDGLVSGSVNSQLQLPEPPIATPVTTLRSQRVRLSDPSKTKLQVTLLTRGVEVSDCPGAQLALASFDGSGAELAKHVRGLSNSAIDGSFGPESALFDLDPAALASGFDVELEVSTGDCGSNYDDMEFTGASAILKD